MIEENLSNSRHCQLDFPQLFWNHFGEIPRPLNLIHVADKAAARASNGAPDWVSVHMAFVFWDTIHVSSALILSASNNFIISSKLFIAT